MSFEDDEYWKEYEAKENLKKELINKVEDLLRSLGVELKVGGCGCCGSPWVSFRYGGVVYLDDLDGAKLDSWNKNEYPRT